VTLFVSNRVEMIVCAFVETGGLLQAGHATQPRCSTRAQRKAELLGGETR
jgi:hypothetical protein